VFDVGDDDKARFPCELCGDPVERLGTALCDDCAPSAAAEPGVECTPAQFRNLARRRFRPKYFVSWGYCGEHREDFVVFSMALAFYREKSGGADGASLIGEGYDCDCDEGGYFMCSDGLTEEERDAVHGD